MAIGPVQLIVLGFSQPDFHGEVIAELERLHDTGLVRVIDSIAVYKKAGRQDLYEKEEAELEVLLAYQPQRISPIEIEALVRNAIGEVGATSPRELGKVMGRLAPQLREKKMDLGAVREVVERMLTESASAG